MTVIRKCDSHHRGVKGIRKVCQLMERCGGCKGVLIGVTPISMLRVYLTVTGEV